MKTKTFLFIVISLVSVASVFATTHIINFGGAFGLVYSPSSLTVEVGDTIMWVGTFSSHPLEATLRPNGAAAFGSGSGTTYSYPVAVAGDYAYHCTNHGGDGMTGTFTAVNPPTGINEATTVNVNIFPLITSDFVNVQLTHQREKISIELLNAEGRVVAVLSASSEGITKVNLSSLNSGIYFVVVKSRKESILKKIVKQ